jgi:hypothetical protein
MDGFDRDILKYMLLWGPHGALYDEDIYPEFGMNVQQFRRRFVHLVASYDLRHLDPADRDLVESARRYLRHCQIKPFRPHMHTGGPLNSATRLSLRCTESDDIA